MEMESTRRPAFDRSREPGMKKPRLEAEPVALEEANPNNRAYCRTASSGATSISTGSGRYWPGHESGIDSASARAEAYQPQSQPQLYHELVCQYKAALAELTFNSKPIITNLTIIAGENLHAAKAVTATICSNILEVPVDQKLPSLYLLDSIVKNIGREYIRYFSTRLPEVFCKAYRKIDPSMHQSMRHLFGTWKGVFPPQTLQVIEKELGFSTSLNNSGAPSTRPDSQAQRPQHSIHVNPKYLERQRLNSRSVKLNRVLVELGLKFGDIHQSKNLKVKGIGSDGSLSVSSNVNDRERVEKVPGSDVGRPWMDKIHPSQREAVNKQINDKKVGISGDSGFTSDLSRNSQGIDRMSGKLAEPSLRGRSWYSGGTNVKEATTSQMNGFPLKHGTVNHSSVKPFRADAQLPSNSGSSSRNIGKISSWKNSEEEEFMWDVHSRLPDQENTKGSSILRKDIWGSDDSEKQGIGDIAKPRRFPDAGLRFDRESSSDSLSIDQKDTAFGNQFLSSWSQASHQGEKLIDSDISVPGITYPENYPSALANSCPKLPSRSSLSLAHTGSPGFDFSGAAVFGISGMAGQSVSQLSSSSIPTQLPSHLADQTFQQSRSNSRPDYKTLQGPGDRHSKLQKLEAEDLTDSSSKPANSLPLQPSVSGLLETSRKPSTSLLLSAVMESGILSKLNTDHRLTTSSDDVWHAQLASQPSLEHIQKPSQVGASLDIIESKSLPETPLQDDPLQKSDRFSDGIPPFLRTPDTASGPISDLLSSLVSKGLISASNSELSTLSSSQKPSTLPSLLSSLTSSKAVSGTHESSASPKPSQAVQNSVSSTLASVPPTPESGNEESSSESALKTTIVVSPLSSTLKSESLIGLHFKPDVLRELHPQVLSALFDNGPHQCTSCGLRLKVKEQLDHHLQLHRCKGVFHDGTERVVRNWYVSADDWVTGKTALPLDVHPPSCADKREMNEVYEEDMVIADDNQFVCILCGELFEDFYNQESDAWMFKGAMRMALSTLDGDNESAKLELNGPIIHVKCSPNILANTLDVKMEKDVKLEK